MPRSVCSQCRKLKGAPNMPRRSDCNCPSLSQSNESKADDQGAKVTPYSGTSSKDQGNKTPLQNPKNTQQTKIQYSSSDKQNGTNRKESPERLNFLFKVEKTELIPPHHKTNKLKMENPIIGDNLVNNMKEKERLSLDNQEMLRRSERLQVVSKNEKNELELEIKSEKNNFDKSLSRSDNGAVKLSLDLVKLLQNKQTVDKTERFKEIESQKNDLRTKLDVMQNENKKLELQKSEIKWNAMNVEEILANLMNENEKLKLENWRVKGIRREKDTLLEDQRKSNSQSEDMHTQLISLTAMSKQTESQKEDLRSELNALEYKNEALEMDLNNLNGIKLQNNNLGESLRITEDEKQRLKLENQELIQENQNLDTELNSFWKQAKDLIEEKEVLLQDKEKCISQEEDLHRQLMCSIEKSKLRTQLNIMQNENKRLEMNLSNINETRLKNKNAEESLADLIKENERLKLENQQLKCVMLEKSTLLEDQRKSNSLTEGIHRQLKQVRSQNEDLRCKLNALENENKIFYLNLSSFSELKLENNNLEESMRITENENQRLNLKNQELIRENQNLDKKLHSFWKQGKDLAEEKEKLLRDNEKHNSQVKDLNEQLISSIEKSNQLESQNNELQTHLTIIKNENQRLGLELNHKSETKWHLEESLANLIKENDGLKLENWQVKDLMREKDGLLENQRKSNSLTEDFHRQLKQAESQNEELKNKLHVMEKENKTFELGLSNLNEIKLQNNNLRENLRIGENEKQRLKLENQELIQENRKLDKELNSFRKQANDLIQEKEVLLQDKEERNSQAEDLRTHLISSTAISRQFKSQNADLRSKLDVMQNENKKLKLELNQTKKLEESLEIKENEHQRLQLKNQELIQENQKLDNELNSFRKQAKDLAEEKDVLLRDKEKYTSQAEDLSAQLISLNAISSQIESQNADLENKLNILEHENKKLKLELDLSNRKGRALRYNENLIEAKEFKEFYDCRIIADSFCTLLDNKSWAIEFNNHEQYKLLKTQNTTKVAVLGYENSGKSFLLSKLTGSELPQGTLMKTTGICLKYPSEKCFPWTALDTPGTNISVKVQQMKESMAQYFEEKNLSDDDRMRMLLGDNILMENLLQKFVVKHAQVLLVVVGKLHRGDQKLINRIKKLQGKRIMIVHNLLDVQNKEDVEKIIQEDICQTFSVTEKPFYLERIENEKGEGMNTKVYLENDERNDGAIEHLVIAHEGSPAGDYYNESAVYYIKTTITSMPFAQPFDLVDAFLQHLNKNLNNYLHSKNTPIGDPFILEKDESGVSKALKLNDHLQYDLKLSSADEFGQIRTFTREGLDNVSYTVKIIDGESDSGVQKVLRVELEIVGSCEDQNIKTKVHRLSNNQVSIEIRGKVEDNAMRGGKGEMLENTRKFGDFSILTERVNLDGYVINFAEKCKRINSEVPGLKILAWNLYSSVEGAW